MTENEKKFGLEVMLAEMEYWKHHKPVLYNTNTKEKGCYVPDFMLLNEARRYFGRPVREDEAEELMKSMNKARLNRHCRFQDYCPKD